MGLLVSDKGLKALKAAVKRKGVVEGSEMARVFAWLRPNDLIWNYWVNNYLLGNEPPAFDILFWNADTTRLPAAFHADLIGIFENSPFVNAGKMEVLGEPIDMRQGRCRCLHRRRHHRPHHAVEGVLRHGAHLWQEERVHPGQRRPPAEPAESAGQPEVVLLRGQGRRPRPRRLGRAAQRATKAAGGRTGWPGCSSARARWLRRRRSWAAASTRRASRRRVNT